MAEGYTPAEDIYREDEFYDERARGQTKDENIEMKNRDDWEQTQDGFAKPPEQETTFVDNLPDAPETIVSVAKEEKIKSYHKFLEDSGYTVDRNAQLDHGAVYKMNANKELAISYEGKIIRLTQANKPNEFLSPTSLTALYNKLHGKGGTHIVRDVLGIKKKNRLRPISLTPCLAKVAEGRVCKWIMDEIHSGVDARQFGNQKGVSTTHCLIDVYHHLISGVEKVGSIGTLVLTDFSKAFDLIDHKIVIVK